MVQMTSYLPHKKGFAGYTIPRRAYIGFPVFFLFAAFWKLKREDTTVAFTNMDLFTGKQEINEEEEAYLEAQNLRGPRTRWKRVWDEL